MAYKRIVETFYRDIHDDSSPFVAFARRLHYRMLARGQKKFIDALTENGSNFYFSVVEKSENNPQLGHVRRTRVYVVMDEAAMMHAKLADAIPNGYETIECDFDNPHDDK